MLPKAEGALRMSINHSLVEYRQAATGKGEGEPAMSRNQTSLSTVAAVRMDSIMISDEYKAMSPVRDQQQISTSRNGMCVLVLLTSPSTPRLYRLRIMLNITKQVVQMHSTATEVGTAVDGNSRFAKIAAMDAVRQSPGTAMRIERSDFDS